MIDQKIVAVEDDIGESAVVEASTVAVEHVEVAAVVSIVVAVTAAVVKVVAVAAVVAKIVAVAAVAGNSPAEASDVPGTALVVAYNSAGWRG